jgi:hypothetical protein
MSRPTLRQLLEGGEVDRLFKRSGSWSAVAAELGVNERTLRRAREEWRDTYRDVDKPIGISINLPEREGIAQSGRVLTDREEFVDEEPTQPGIPVDVVPERHVIKGVSSFVVDGEVRGQWIKTTAQNDERAAWMEAIRGMSDSLPRLEPTPHPESSDCDLLAVYPVGDPHVGLRSWHEDAGENFDLDIAKHRYISAFKHLIDLAPPAREALIIFIGDTAHADGQNNTTTKGTRVDVDSRTIKMARTIIEISRYAIDLALEKHGHVTKIIERGNHDELISAMIALGLSLLYENEPRVTIDVSPQMFHWFRFGQNLIGTHHGDKVKPMDLLGVMAVDRQQDWGETTHRRFYLGHYHHQIVKEVPGLVCEYLPTLASSDAWHHAMGYRSSKAMYMDVFHRERGHIDRHIVGVQQLAKRSA